MEPAEGRVKVFVLAGQSNMEGKAKVQLLEYQVNQPATRGLFQHYRRDGKWVERDDVWIKFLVGSDWPFHYLGSARTLCAIGKAMAEAVIALRGEGS